MSTTTEPKYFRAPIAHVGPDQVTSVDRDGGQFGYGSITGVSIITAGKALGHDLWIDQDFLSDVTAAINGTQVGLKARFTHPGLSSDGVGSKLGKFTNATMVGEQVFADLHFQEAATKTPDGNLADYVLSLAEETPEDFGLSIVFEHDFEAMQQHQEDNTVTNAGRRIFTSPDENNLDNYPHARLRKLRAADVVDSPAANPDGLFQRGQDAAKDGEQLLEYVLGLSDAKPDSSMFNVDGDRGKQFLTRFLSRHQLTIVKGGDSVSNDAAPQETVAETPPTQDEFKAELKRYTTAFGAENGTEWFTDGVSFEDGQQKQIELQAKKIIGLQAKVDELAETLKSLDRGEEEGGEFPGVEETAPKTFAGKIRITGKQYASSN